MGFNVSKKNGFNSDINVTPFVDVVLVLLVIFMITAPLMFNGINLTLPKTKKVHRLNLTQSQVILSMTRKGDYFLGKEKVPYKELVAEIKSQFKSNKSNVVFLRADYGIKYGEVATLMSHLKRSGITNIALVTEIEK